VRRPWGRTTRRADLVRARVLPFRKIMVDFTGAVPTKMGCFL